MKEKTGVMDDGEFAKEIAEAVKGSKNVEDTEGKQITPEEILKKKDRYMDEIFSDDKK